MKKQVATTMLLTLLFTAGLAHANHWRPSWVFQAENVLAQADDPNDRMYYGAATLKRTKFKIDGRIMTFGENAGEAYTVWFVIFNYPEFCMTSPCSAADLPPQALPPGAEPGDPRVDVAVFNGAGAISAWDGKKGRKKAGVINVDFEALAGRTPEGMCCFGSLAPWNGLKAEVHVVVDKHPDTVLTDENYWPVHLTTPFMGHRFAIFLPAD